MALVAYDYDSGSDNEEEPSTSSAVVIIEKNVKETQQELNDGEETEKVPDILSHLPQTKTEAQLNVLDDKLEDFIPKYESAPKAKKTQKVKIAIPALSQFEEEEEPVQKRAKVSSTKGSNLLSMLPPVRGSIISTKSFIPKVLKKKPTQSKPGSLVPHAVRKKAEEAKKAAIRKITKLDQGSDAESDLEDFEVPETYDDEIWQKVCGTKSKPKPQVIEAPEEVTEIPEINIAPETAKPYDGLDNKAFKELVGKAKRPVNIKLIDINEEEILEDKDRWITKSLTDPEIKPPPAEVEDPVDPTRKKKHHITYLAEQAKANEQELQTSWSASKYARIQTRAKYGF